MSFVSQVNPDELPIPCYELKVEAIGAKDGRKIEVTEKYPVTDFFDDLGYCHFHHVQAKIIDDIFKRLAKQI